PPRPASPACSGASYCPPHAATPRHATRPRRHATPHAAETMQPLRQRHTRGDRATKAALFSIVALYSHLVTVDDATLKNLLSPGSNPFPCYVSAFHFSFW
ncbi:hypothetical protein ACQ4N7_30190, partial [Nodosilinea sp. AN01ver1]|uniref:hypothetical protein n=1 Tax=Nodosilinea sp. AN01ver1 TaxID=3423362 RepID=UPI003D31EB56